MNEVEKSGLSVEAEEYNGIKNSKQSSGLSKESEKYFYSLQKGINENYKVAEEARKKGLDPVDNVEVPLALSMAAKVVKLIATKYSQLDREDVINRILELEKKYGSLDNSLILNPTTLLHIQV